MNRLVFVLTALVAACGPRTDAEFEQTATLSVKAGIDAQLAALVTAVTALQAAAPAPDADGWNATADAAAVDAMKGEWKKARVAYEKVEGAIAVLFPDLDAATDERYDGFIATEPDTDLFDDRVVTGIHAVERILWADAHADHVVAFESALPNYVAAAFPANETEATEFRTKLLQKLVDDTTAMRDGAKGLALDASAAFRGVIGSLEEQHEKVRLASTGEDESRYARHTLADMRANLSGGLSTYHAFAPWLQSKDGGAAIDAAIEEGFTALAAALDAVAGESIPEVPEGFDPDQPSEAHLATPYGRLFAVIRTQADVTQAGSLAAQMTAAADLLGIPRLAE